MTKVGFTGTQNGMTDDQKAMVKHLLLIIEGCEFHHGDCIGSDAESAAMAKELGYTVMSHPPTNNSKRAYFNSDYEELPKAYLARNHDIVEETEILIATPMTAEKQLRSGTWSTIRYAQKRSRKLVIVLPNGDITDAI